MVVEPVVLALVVSVVEALPLLLRLALVPLDELPVLRLALLSVPVLALAVLALPVVSVPVLALAVVAAADVVVSVAALVVLAETDAETVVPPAPPVPVPPQAVSAAAVKPATRRPLMAWRRARKVGCNNDKVNSPSHGATHCCAQHAGPFAAGRIKAGASVASAVPKRAKKP